MGFCADNHISAIRNYAQRHYGKNVFTKHFILRAYQRFTPEERMSIFAELHSLVRGGMHKHLFTAGMDKCHLLLQNKYEVVFTMDDDGGLVMKTIFVPNASRKRKLAVNIDGSTPTSH